MGIGVLLTTLNKQTDTRFESLNRRLQCVEETSPIASASLQPSPSEPSLVAMCGGVAVKRGTNLTKAASAPEGASTKDVQPTVKYIIRNLFRRLSSEMSINEFLLAAAASRKRL